MEFLVKEGFQCDNKAKQIVGKAFKEYIEENYKGWKVDTAATESEFDHIDITATAYTPNQSRLIGIEVKERWDKQPEQYKDEFCNVDKDFEEYRNSGYTILWASIYRDCDNKIPIYIWDFDKAPKTFSGRYPIKKHNVLDEKPIWQDRYGLQWKDTIIRIYYDKDRDNRTDGKE